jgi:uncharacterized protein YfaS (alpha-2-macroglobulin family)
MHGPSARETSVVLSPAELLRAPSAALSLSVQGTGTLYYLARLRYARRNPATEPIERGFGVRKTMRVVTQEDIDQAMRAYPLTGDASAPAAATVLIDLYVSTTSPRDNVVVNDPLPAGLVAEQPDLATAAKWLWLDRRGAAIDEAASHEDDVAMERGFSQAWYARQVRDDRVVTLVPHMEAGLYHFRYAARATTPGRFVAPPARAMCIDEPEVFGATAAQAFEVVPPAP